MNYVPPLKQLSHNYNLININVYMNIVHFVLKIFPLYTVGEF